MAAKGPKTLSVRLLGFPVGQLRQLETGRLEFAYLPEYLAAAEAFPLSMSLPLRRAPFDHVSAAPFFAGYLTDDPSARRALARMFQISEGNDFALLAAIGRDCAGAVSLHPADEPVIPDEEREARLRPLNPVELADRVRALASRPLFVDAEGEVRLSLAGAQPKAAIVMTEDGPALPLGGTPSTHILKASIDGVPDHLISEHCALWLARACGLPTARSELRQADDVEYLLVERYDRAKTTAGRIVRIHQEDMCQALGILPERRYENEGGPGLRAIFALLNETADPAHDRLGFLDAVIFNAMIGNTDAHGKNFSLIYADGIPRLAPLYDLTALRVYDSFHGEPASKRMAMKIAGKALPEELYRRHWFRFAEANQLSPAATAKRVSAIADKLHHALDKLLPEMAETLPRHSDMPARIREDAARRIERMASQVLVG